MNQLKDDLSRNETKQKIRNILIARKALYDAGVRLLECDDVYAGDIKTTLEKLTFASKTVDFVGAGGSAKMLDKSIVRFYLEKDMRIYVKEENIIVDLKNNICRIKLNNKTTANVTIKIGVAIKSCFYKK